ALIAADALGAPRGFAGVVILLDVQAPAAATGARTPAPADPDNLACIIYTSGSSGVPKGVAISHRGICRMVFDPGNAAVGRFDTMSQLSPVAFDASTFEIWAALLHGARLVIVHRDIVLSAAALRAEIERQQFSVMFLTSALFHEMSRQDPSIVSGVTTVLVGGETADSEAFRRVLKTGPPGRLLHMYGPAEAVTFASRFPVADVPAEAASIAIGRPVANIGLYILDRNQHPVPLGATGELYVAGDCIARGYLRRPALTAERFLPDPFGNEPDGRMYRTGDRARYLPDGTIEFLGRFDNQLKLRGFRIEPREIEAVLLRHPHVAEAAVVTWRRGASYQVLTAFVAHGGRRPEAGELRRFVQARLPDYMVPSIVVLDRLPRNANGKLDRSALPEPRLVEDGDAGDAPPRTPAERTLSRIWAEVLGLERVGLHHNFFAIGGDSILAIQVVARAAAAGLSVTPQMIFQNQTIAALATVCEQSVGTISAKVSGPTPLTPIQQWFFERHRADVHHFNQAVCLELKQPASADEIQRALAFVATRHAVLRCRFEDRAGRWSQRVADDKEAWPLRAIDLSHIEAAHIEAAYLEHAAAIAGGLDLARGPLARAALFDLGSGRPARLILVIHHLVVDAVSWQIVLEDLDAACLSARQGRPTALLPVTTPFQLWAQRLRQYADCAELRDQMRHWTSLDDAPAPLPIDGHWGENDEASARTVALHLSVAETEALLRQLPKAYRTRVEDALLAALMLAITRWTGEGALLIDVEGHGREPLFGDVDLSRTVGWFTSLFPVRLELGGVAAAGEALIAVKEQVRAIPARGIGFGLLRYLCSSAEGRDRLAAMPHPEIAFNYLGQSDGLLRNSELFRTTALDTGPQVSLRQKRTHLLAVDAIVTRGRLRVDWTFSTNRHRPETIEQLAQDMADGLRAIIRHCRTGGAFTPGDFPLARLDGAALDRLWRLDPSIEDVYPLSPLQHGMLFHTLYAPDSGAYVEQYQFTLDGEMDSDAL
ncbi:non-ribosomal peptide synthetase, partial [Mesorhizobium mediterraneum]|uniref:non-ribosomal peptide synthetase n=1 Tax=Mesorhizobium mediterraneum TaxID=43617 RepID=UPI0017863C90